MLKNVTYSIDEEVLKKFDERCKKSHFVKGKIVEELMKKFISKNEKE